MDTSREAIRSTIDAAAEHAELAIAVLAELMQVEPAWSTEHGRMVEAGNACIAVVVELDRLRDQLAVRDIGERAGKPRA